MAAYRRKVRGGPLVSVDGLGLHDAVRAMWPASVPWSWAGQLVAALEGAARGERRRVVVSVPVRHGKTFLVSHALAWMIATKPETTCAYLTYSQKLSDRFSRKIRNLAESCGVQLKDDHNRIEEWRTTKDGGLLSSAVGGPITGYGADVIIVDDPMKGRETAESEGERDRAWDWLTDDVYTRLQPNASMFVVAARWHDDDPSGRILRGELKGEAWEVIHYRAIEADSDGAERALWPELWPLAELQRRRASLPERTWLSLYQGEPRPPEGAVFRGAMMADDFPSFR